MADHPDVSTTATGNAWHPRYVDSDNQGWLPTLDGDGQIVYRADYGTGRGLPARSLPELVATRGPIRPVLPITDEDQALLEATFTTAGRKTITTIASALEEVFHRARETRGGLSAVHDSYHYAMRTLTAGREGSWESELLKQVVLLGNGLNLAPPRQGANNTVEALRRRGPSRRVAVAARDVLVDVFSRWVCDPARYTEVAETLAWVVSCHADRTAGPGGWTAVADQWLQPAGLAREDFTTCYRLFYSLSEHFDTGLI